MGAVGEAAFVTAPITGNVIRISVDDGVDRFAIPAAFAGKPCSWVLYGTDADIVFGGSAVTCVYDQDSSGGASPVGHADAGLRLKDGVRDYWVMPAITADVTHFAIDAIASGSGKLQISISGGG